LNVSLEPSIATNILENKGVFLGVVKTI